jgi:hypothetical protein
MFRPSEQRTLHTSATVSVVRGIVREQLQPLLADAPRAWFGGRMTLGVRGVILGNYMILVPVAVERRLWSNRKSPTVIGRIVSRSDGGADVQVSVYTPGYPYRTVKDATATAILHDWMSRVARKLDADWSRPGDND